MSGYEVDGKFFKKENAAVAEFAEAKKRQLLKLCAAIAQKMENPRDEDYGENEFTVSTVEWMADALYTTFVISSRGEKDMLDAAIAMAKIVLADKTKWRGHIPEFKASYLNN